MPDVECQVGPSAVHWEATLRVPGAPRGTRPLGSYRQRAAILVVDAQPCYWSESTLIRSAFPDLPKNTAALLSRARANGIPIVHIRAAYQVRVHVCARLCSEQQVTVTRTESNRTSVDTTEFTSCPPASRSGRLWTQSDTGSRPDEF